MANTLVFTLLGRDRVSHTLNNIGDNAERAARRLEDGNSRSGRSFSAILPAIGGAALSMGKYLAIAGSAIPATANLVATLVNIAPAAGLAATGLIAAGTAGAALKIGLSGVSDSIAAVFDPKKAKQFDDTLKRLSPNAKAFVLQLKDLKPALDKVKHAIQDKLFAGMDEQLKSLKTTLPVFQTALEKSAEALNLMGRGVATAVKDLANSGALGKALTSARKGLVNLSGAPALVVQALGQIGAAAGPSFERLTGMAGDAMDRLSGKMTSAFKSGAMQKAIETAITAIGQLVKVGANVGKILGNIFGAAQASGGGMVGVLQDITGELAKVTASKGVQEALHQLFSTMAALGKTVAPLLGEALKQIAPVLSALGPPARVLIKALGDGLRPIIKALGPVLVEAAGAVGKLVTALAPLLPVIGQVIADLLPTLTPVLQTFAGVFAKLAPVIKQVADQIGPILTPIIAGLGDVLNEMVTQYADQFLKVLQLLLPVLPQLVPVALQFADSLGQILSQLAPLLPQIMMLSTQFLTQLLPAILPLVPPLLKLATLWIRLATDVIIGLVIPTLKKLVGFVQGMHEKLQPAIDAAKAVTKGIAHAFEWLYDHLIGHSVIPDTVNGIVRWFAGLPGKAVGALGNIGSRLGSVMSRAGSSMLTAIRHGLGNVVSAVKGLPGRARSALGSAGSALVGAGRELVNGMISGLRSRIPSLTSIARSMAKSAVSGVKGALGISSPSKVFIAIGKETGKGMIIGLTSTKARINAVAKDLAADITRAFKGKKTKVDDRLVALIAKDNKKLQKLADQRDKIAAKIKEARAFAASVTSTSKGTAALSNIGEDALTGGGGGIKAHLQGKLAQIKQFSKYISILAKRGLNKTMLREILEMGPEQGFAYASELAGSSKKTISEINSVQSKINKESKKLGTKGADLLYDSGKNASKGFLAGLKSQQKSIEKLMLDIAKAMQKAIRKALGIKSPSTVMAKLGGYTTEGLAAGITGRMPVLAGALAKVSDAVTSTQVAFSPAPAVGPAAASGGGPVFNVNVTFTGLVTDRIGTAKEIVKVINELARTTGQPVRLGVVT